MVILDTNHMDVLMIDHPRRDLLLNRLRTYDRGVFTSIVSVQENIDGLLPKIKDGNAQPHRWVPYYTRLWGVIRFYSQWKVVQFDDAAAQEFVRLKSIALKGPGTN